MIGDECKCKRSESGIDLAIIDRLVMEVGATPDRTIPLLQAVQNEFNYLPPIALEHIAEITDIPASRLSGVSTFYSQFRHRPAGEHTIRVCVGTACHVKGAPRIIDALRRFLRIPDGDDTDLERKFTIEPVACLGCCTLAPVMLIDDVTYGHMTPKTVESAIRDFLSVDRTISSSTVRNNFTCDGDAEIRIGLGSCCVARGSRKVSESFELALEEYGVTARVKRVGCVGMCHQTPLVEIVRSGMPIATYACVDPTDAKRIVRRHFKSGNLIAGIKGSLDSAVDWMFTDERHESVTRYSLDMRDKPVAAFLGPQKHIALEHCGHIDPLDIDEYERRDGFSALKKACVEMTPSDIISCVSSSGLRGRGGAGFSTGVKWRMVASQEECQKFIVMNGDEGDPGAFMDRMLLESYPFRIIEGIVLAAYAVGAHDGYLYVREEYPLAVMRVNEAIKLCEERGYLGDNICGSGFSLHLRIMEGAGAFVCGEESALLASIEGRRGTPRLRPPYPSEKGLWGKPTLVNNVETYANVPWIIRNGASAFSELGTERSKGTKVFALAGKVARGGLIEVPMGVTIRQVVMEIGGGVGDGREFKAVQIGGPSGGCVPAAECNTPIDYETLASMGAIMGSGGLVVLDDTDCMVDIARYFLEFTQDQSCGRCTFCRVGTHRMLDILTNLCEGRGRKGDIELLEDLARSVKRGSLCGLGQTAPNPVLSTIKYFRHEYEAHIEGRCPAGKCQSLICYDINEKCIGCTLCAQACPVDAIRPTPYERHIINSEKCTCCDMCRQVCPVDAVEVR